MHPPQLRRDRTPREIVAQALDYGSWAATLSREKVLELFSAYKPGDVFETAFLDRFGQDPPATLNAEHQLTIVASDLDPASERIVGYLSATYQVPINVLLFRYFCDGDRAYLARTWLLDESSASEGNAARTRSKTESWNGLDWYVTLGEDGRSRSWEDAERYGFVSAGGGTWYSRTFKALPVGARVNVCLPGTG